MENENINISQNNQTNITPNSVNAQNITNQPTPQNASVMMQNIPTVEQSTEKFISNTQSISKNEKPEKKKNVNFIFVIFLFIIIFVTIYFLFPILLQYI